VNLHICDTRTLNLHTYIHTKICTNICKYIKKTSLLNNTNNNNNYPNDYLQKNKTNTTRINKQVHKHHGE